MLRSPEILPPEIPKGLLHILHGRGMAPSRLNKGRRRRELVSTEEVVELAGALICFIFDALLLFRDALLNDLPLQAVKGLHRRLLQLLDRERGELVSG